MINYIKVLLIVILFSSCSLVDKKKYRSISSKEILFNKSILDKKYIGMTKKQIIYIFGIPIIADSFDDVYHYNLYDHQSYDLSRKDMLNLHFKNNKVSSFDIT